MRREVRGGNWRTPEYTSPVPHELVPNFGCIPSRKSRSPSVRNLDGETRVLPRTLCSHNGYIDRLCTARPCAEPFSDAYERRRSCRFGDLRSAFSPPPLPPSSQSAALPAELPGNIRSSVKLKVKSVKCVPLTIDRVNQSSEHSTKLQAASPKGFV